MLRAWIQNVGRLYRTGIGHTGTGLRVGIEPAQINSVHETEQIAHRQAFQIVSFQRMLTHHLIDKQFALLKTRYVGLALATTGLLEIRVEAQHDGRLILIILQQVGVR